MEKNFQKNEAVTVVDNEQSGGTDPRLKNRFIIFSIVLFLVILVVGSFAFMLSMRQINRTNKGSDVLFLYSSQILNNSSVLLVN